VYYISSFLKRSQRRLRRNGQGGGKKTGVEGWAWWPMLIIQTIQEAEIRRIEVQGQPRQKVSKTPSQSIMWVYWHASVVPAIWEALDKRIKV
jgi:hypothetical protein